MIWARRAFAPSSGMKSRLLLLLSLLFASSVGANELPEESGILIKQLEQFEEQAIAQAREEIQVARRKAAERLREHRSDDPEASQAIERAVLELQYPVQIRISPTAEDKPAEFAPTLFAEETWRTGKLPGRWDSDLREQNRIEMLMQKPAPVFGIVPKYIQARKQDGKLELIGIHFVEMSPRYNAAFMEWMEAYHLELEHKHGPRKDWPAALQNQAQEDYREASARISSQSEDPIYDNRFQEIETTVLEALTKRGGSHETIRDTEIAPGIRDREIRFEIGPSVVTYQSRTRSMLMLTVLPSSTVR